MKWIKFFVAIVLLPLCVALTLSLGRLAIEFGASASFWGKPLLFFALGFGMWLIIFIFLPPPVKTYVLGHELTHALWAWLMGGKARGLKVGNKGGHVRVTVSNFGVLLAPYFFPLYMVVAGLLFGIASLIWNTSDWRWLLFYALGFTWSFHVTFTGLALAQPQSDVKTQGWLFSMVVIYAANVLVALVLLTFLHPHYGWNLLGRRIVEDTLAVYGGLARGVLSMFR